MTQVRTKTDLARSYLDDGVICVPGLLDPESLDLAEEAFGWSLDNPSPAAQRLFPDAGTVFYQDLFNTLSWPHYMPLVQRAGLGPLMARLWQSREVWFFFEQVFHKVGAGRRTPWHQDTSYFPVEGEHLSVVWISLDRVSKEQALEFVRGSHKGTIFNGAAFTGDDDTAPLYDEGAMPRLPDIEASRAAYDIVSWATEPGDGIIFHPSVLHGGGQTDAGEERRTVSLRFFGDDCRFVSRPSVSKQSAVGFNRNETGSRNVEEFYEGLSPGDLFRHPDFIALEAA
ncbi:phytanoyl-CoA dioxygenase [Novosphingobium marinum]|uniref:Ectoine hydroxylase-related dioxygenase (Phytanoyl-CoA dioxygenase family) n=1 Tax=Novosphingobium marinum TaxID=1514948 RepID=A0A7Z0BT91_9SPHN|nr:phytanoyl-CoA dioxygenase family protein [Novosphingobium marinum]NYH94954.1 ectoine hydroxylase-related dioxygenase (phytanoyl-CoA dioxygenase family) [Novosphingobium marinum]GGC41315.1 phytanoyl-CoA dioxygenase [Novosphingobium marinum]